MVIFESNEKNCLRLLAFYFFLNIIYKSQLVNVIGSVQTNNKLYFNWKCFLCLDHLKLFQCNRCGRKYQHRGTLSRHIGYECGVESKFKCVFCAKKFSRKDLLKLHAARKHGIFL